MGDERLEALLTRASQESLACLSRAHSQRDEAEEEKKEEPRAKKIPRYFPLLPATPRYSPLLPATPRYSPLLPVTPRCSPLLPATPHYSPLLPPAATADLA